MRIRTGHCPPLPSLTTTHCALANKYSIFHTTAMPMSREIFSSTRHVARTGTHADVDIQAEFNNDVKQAAATALATTKPGEGLNPLDKNNPWAFFDHYIDRVAAQCVNTLTPKWSTKLGGFDVYVWDQCYSMEQTLRIE